MKILFINPPGKEELYSSPPLGIAYLASVLRDRHEVDIVDCGIEGIGGLEKMMESFGPDVVGMTAMTPVIEEALETIKIVKRINPDIKIILGGAHVTVLPEETMEKNLEIDIAVVGEGEETIRELVSTLEKGGDLNKVNGIAFRKNGRIVVTKPREMIKNLDSIPFPARDLLPIEKYRQSIGHGGRYTTLITTRGCPFNCLYCVKCIFGRVYRARSPENILKEIETIVRDYGIRELVFYDDTFTLNKDRIMKLCDLIVKSGIKMSWKCETRVDLVDGELLRKMKRAGCYMIAYGVESGDPQLLKVIRKGISKEQIRKAFRMTKEVGMEIVAYFMIGIPGETRRTIQETLDFALELDPDYAQFSITTPLPGTDLYKLAVEKKLISVKDWSSFSYLGSRSKPLMELESISPEELERERKRIVRSFYLRPRFVLRHLKKMRDVSTIKKNINSFRVLLKNIG